MQKLQPFYRDRSNRFQHRGNHISKVLIYVPIRSISLIFACCIRIYVPLSTPMADNRPVGVSRVTTSASRSRKQDHETNLQH